MLLIKKSDEVSGLYAANVIVSALSEDVNVALNVIKELNVNGLSEMLLLKNPGANNDYWYWRKYLECADQAICYVIVLTSNFFIKNNADRSKLFWYEIGVLQSKGCSIIPYWYGIERIKWDEYISKTPIRQVQGTDDLYNIVVEIEKTNTLRKNFFNKREISYYANSRVFYSELSVMFNINNGVLDGILERLQFIGDDSIKTRADVLSLLQREVHCGIKIKRFGKKCFYDHPYYRYYIDEAVPLNIDCKVKGDKNTMFILQSGENDEQSMVKVDYVIPNHEIFGVSFKPYFEIKKNASIQLEELVDILNFETQNGLLVNKMDIYTESNEKTERVYFSLYFNDDYMITECEGEAHTCNYLYAK